MQYQPKFRHFVLFGLLFGCGFLLKAQNDNEGIKINPEQTISAGEKFDIIFQRGILVNVGMADSVPIDPTHSGTVSLGFSYGIPLGRPVAFKFEPRVTWHTVHYKPEPQKRFPSIGDSALVYEKHRNVYLEMGAGFKFNLIRNAENTVKLFLETGGFGGYQISNFYKIRTERLDGNNEVFRHTAKYHTVEGTEKLRYGLYGRLGTNWIALLVQYRLSDIFTDKPTQTYLFPGVDYTYPKISPLEIGITVKL